MPPTGLYRFAFSTITEAFNPPISFLTSAIPAKPPSIIITLSKTTSGRAHEVFGKKNKNISTQARLNEFIPITIGSNRDQISLSE